MLKSEEFTNNKDSADYYRIIIPPDTSVDNLFTVNEYYKNGKKKLIAKSTGEGSFTRFEGTCIEYFPNGHRRSVKSFEHGKPVGDETEYFPNGKVYYIGTYDSKNKLVVNAYRDSTGKVLVENGNGHCVKYDDDFKYIFAEGDLVNGLEEGEWHGWLRDSGRYVCTYQKGVDIKGIGYDKNGKAYPFAKIMVDPAFNGGIEKFYSFISHTLQYPKEAKDHNIQGKVLITFIVNRDGKLSDFRVVSGLGFGLDDEVLRVMRASPPWLPGYQFGMLVKVAYSIPITFSMTNEE
ncbi:MAG TPA: TonB family protein [Mucilaginibacter sp.]|nr:TonB family protein [Mucilaginibacter sp.]